MAFKHMSMYNKVEVTNIGCMKNNNKFSLMILEK